MAGNDEVYPATTTLTPTTTMTTTRKKKKKKKYAKKKGGVLCKSLNKNDDMTMQNNEYNGNGNGYGVYDNGYGTNKDFQTQAASHFAYPIQGATYANTADKAAATVVQNVMGR